MRLVPTWDQRPNRRRTTTRSALLAAGPYTRSELQRRPTRRPGGQGRSGEHSATPAMYPVVAPRVDLQDQPRVTAHETQPDVRRTGGGSAAAHQHSEPIET